MGEDSTTKTKAGTCGPGLQRAMPAVSNSSVPSFPIRFHRSEAVSSEDSGSRYLVFHLHQAKIDAK